MLWKLLCRSMVVTMIAVWAADAANAADGHPVDFRLVNWKTQHVDGAQKAAEQEKVFKQLGCEVKVDSHGGHHDVSYRCPQWRRLAAESDAVAHRWQDWLKGRGFEVKHAH